MLACLLPFPLQRLVSYPSGYDGFSPAFPFTMTCLLPFWLRRLVSYLRVRATLPKLNKCTMPPRKMHHAPMSSHRPAVFVWDVKCTMGMVHSTLSTVGSI